MSSCNYHNLRLSDPWFNLVKEGKKCYEGRCYFKEVPNYKVGDIIIFSNLDKTNSFKKKIKALHKFPTFEESLRKLPLSEVLPGIKSVEEGVEIYKKYVKIETQKEYGVCLIELTDVS